jgi:hypothetical protein
VVALLMAVAIARVRTRFKERGTAAFSLHKWIGSLYDPFIQPCITILCNIG